MPVVLVFESIPILTASGTLFTNGNAASYGTLRGDSADFFRKIPFEKVYHDSVLKESEKGNIVFHRCAEVLVPNSLELSQLTHVLCRSQAEYETLTNLLSAQCRAKYAKKIGVSGRVHFKHWTYVESVDLDSQRANFRFNPSSLTPGPFAAKLEIIAANGDIVGRWSNENYRAAGSLALRFTSIGNLDTYRVRLTFDDLLAYYGVFEASEKLL